MKNSNSINEKIIAMNNSERVFDFLVNMLEYKNSPNFCEEKNDDYDAFNKNRTKGLHVYRYKSL